MTVTRAPSRRRQSPVGKRASGSSPRALEPESRRASTAATGISAPDGFGSESAGVAAGHFETERGQFLGQSVQVIERIVTALDGSLSVDVRWHGEQLDRLIDSVHASVQAAIAEMLSDRGWVVRVEVSFNRYGERGRCDILAIHPRSGTLLVVEVKSRLATCRRPWVAST
jgi:hypothetical protein